MAQDAGRAGGQGELLGQFLPLGGGAGEHELRADGQRLVGQVAPLLLELVGAEVEGAEVVEGGQCAGAGVLEGGPEVLQLGGIERLVAEERDEAAADGAEEHARLVVAAAREHLPGGAGLQVGPGVGQALDGVGGGEERVVALEPGRGAVLRGAGRVRDGPVGAEPGQPAEVGRVVEVGEDQGAAPGQPGEQLGAPGGEVLDVVLVVEEGGAEDQVVLVQARDEGAELAVDDLVHRPAQLGQAAVVVVAVAEVVPAAVEQRDTRGLGQGCVARAEQDEGGQAVPTGHRRYPGLTIHQTAPAHRVVAGAVGLGGAELARVSRPDPSR